MERLTNLLDYLIKELVEKKEEVKIEYETVDNTVTFRVQVAHGEMGKIIGKNGMTAGAIRGIMQAAAVKDQMDVKVEFLD